MKVISLPLNINFSSFLLFISLLCHSVLDIYLQGNKRSKDVKDSGAFYTPHKLIVIQVDPHEQNILVKRQ